MKKEPKYYDNTLWIILIVFLLMFGLFGVNTGERFDEYIKVHKEISSSLDTIKVQLSDPLDMVDDFGTKPVVDPNPRKVKK